MRTPDRCETDLALVSGAYAALYLLVCAAWSAAGVTFRAGDLLPFAVLLGFAVLLHVEGTRRAPFLLSAAPYLLWPLLYVASVNVVSRRPERFVDAVLARADAWLLGREVGPPHWPLGGPVEELANVFYTSYYVVIPGGFLWLWHARGPAAARRYTVGVMAALAACAALWLVMPAGGYHPTGSPTSEGFGPFTATARLIYAANPHHAAAFPSSHVALAVAAAAGLVAHGAGRAWWLWALGVAWSTIYGQYHYAVDAPPGVLVGLGAATWALRAETAIAWPAAPRPWDGTGTV